MIQALVAVLMWLLVACLLVVRRRRRERSLTYAALTIAVAMTLNVDVIYIFADSLLGASNVATLVADGGLMIGLFFLGGGIMRAGEYRPGPVRVALSRLTLLVALVGIIGTFFAIDRGRTTTAFMLDLGAQPAAAAYSIIGFTYCGVVVAAMALLAARQFRLGDGAQRVPAALVCLGSVVAVAFCAVVVIMDIAHVVGDIDLMNAVSRVYGPLHILTFLFLCVGLAGQPIVRYLQARARTMRADALMGRLEPIWDRAILIRPGLSQVSSSASSGEDAQTRLHRTVVEIRDAMIDPRNSFQLNETDQRLLEQAERHLLGGHGRNAEASSSRQERHGRGK